MTRRWASMVTSRSCLGEKIEDGDHFWGGDLALAFLVFEVFSFLSFGVFLFFFVFDVGSFGSYGNLSFGLGWESE